MSSKPVTWGLASLVCAAVFGLLVMNRMAASTVIASAAEWPTLEETSTNFIT